MIDRGGRLKKDWILFRFFPEPSLRNGRCGSSFRPLETFELDWNVTLFRLSGSGAGRAGGALARVSDVPCVNLRRLWCIHAVQSVHWD